MNRQVGIVVGLRSEAACLTNTVGAEWVFGAAARPERARAGAEALVAAGATALISFGVAGGLDARLAPGALVIGDSVILPENQGRLAADPDWCRRVADRIAATRIATARIGTVVGSPVVLPEVADKARAFAETAALAVDMESQEVARVAAGAGLPFLVIRAVADPASRALPPPALCGIALNGTLQPMTVIRRLAAAPGHLPGLIRLAFDSRAAFLTLRQAVAAGAVAF